MSLPRGRLVKVPSGAGDQGIKASVPGNPVFSPEELWLSALRQLGLRFPVFSEEVFSDLALW